RRMLRAVLESEGYRVREAGTAADAIEKVRERAPEAVLLDLALPGESGLDALPRLLEAAPGTPVVMMSGQASMSDAVAATRLGAFHFIEKPLTPEAVLLTIRSALEVSRARDLSRALREELGPEAELVGATPSIQRVRELVRKVAPTEARVLITGESGTGKELVAAAIHRISSRAKRAFIPVNCSAIPQDLLESEFFGHVRGAFSGAIADALGLFRGADEGTIFLDEIAELTPALQVKLLRVLQEMQVRPVGSTKAYPVDVRVIAATNRDLERAMTDGSFRQDLFYRLNVVRVLLPPLRDRRDDIPALVSHFLRRFNRRFHREVRGIAPEALAALSAYSFPGNVRELENLVERAFAMGAKDQLTLADLPALARTPATAAAPVTSVETIPTLADVERELILKSLALLKDDKEAAARALGISRRTIYRRLKEYGIL
ncbi:MAG TPA: sigma-54 dependent transcriptional regulator, partial [Candidatus Limnocylindria bacterium]|nr:sigma-54 dependent transcriptional regulator [Candidatus Limnocylindria bacterium]